MGGASSLSLGIVSCGHWVVVLFVGDDGHRLWVLGVIHGCSVVVCGRWVFVIVGGGARLRGRIFCGC